MGVCCVVRDARGRFIHVYSKTIPGCPTPIEFEAIALKEALLRILRLQLSNVFIEMDYKSVVERFSLPQLQYLRIWLLITKQETVMGEAVTTFY